jgi:phospholipase/carboxylesterase
MNHEHIVVPSPTGSPRTFIALHGTGGDERSLIPLAQALDPAAAVLSPRGNVMEGANPRFFRRLAEGVFDVEDLVQRTHDLADFLLDVAAKHDLDLNHAIAVGYSNGANIAASLFLHRPEVLGSAILIRSMIPTEPQVAPNLIGKRILMLTGERDPLVTPDNPQQLGRMLSSYGADVTFELLNAGHELTRRDLELAQEWLASTP